MSAPSREVLLMMRRAGLVGIACTMTPAHAADPWQRPEHARAIAVPSDGWNARSAPVAVRLFWDGSETATVAVRVGRRWKVVSRTAETGFTSPSLPRDAEFRIRLTNGARWSPIIRVDPVDDPVSTGRIGGWGGADVVGQITHDRKTGNVYASTVGGGLLVRVASEQPLAGAQATVGQWQILGREDGLPDVRAVSVDARDGTVLVGTAQGLAVMQGTDVVEVVDEALPDSYVQSVHVGADGAWWVGTYHGLAHRPPGADAYATVLAPWSVFSLSDAREGGVWVGYEGLQRVAADGTVTSWLDDVYVYGSVDTPEGVLAATTERGVLVATAPGVARPVSRLVDRDA
ncbi:MAG TPA: hypothetical protein DFR83_12420, partial [Deltaproteobacteria bacterium]|nr:hypothetical protein [Deltaproteobacteria bacterium]